MNKYFLLLLALHSAPSFSWTIADKILYDNYKSCLNHKLKDVDISKINIQSAREAFNEDCRKAFCSDKREVTEEEFNSCLSRLKNYPWGPYDKLCREKTYKDSSCKADKV